MADRTCTARLLDAAAKTFADTAPFRDEAELIAGVDLGTASIVLAVLDAERNPVACEMECAGVVKDGLVVDYFGAMTIVKRLKARLEERLGCGLYRAAIAVPPGTDPADAGTHRHVVEACELEVTGIVDEPTAANRVLGLQNGAVVDIGGGTTGLTIFREGEPVYTADEATGGTHVSLVLMGNRRISFQEAEAVKRDAAQAAQTMAVVRPVIQKMAGIVNRHIRGWQVDDMWLVGGTCCLPGIEAVFQKETGVPARVPPHPQLVTPLGIAMCC